MRLIYIAIALLFTLVSTALSAQYQRDKKRDFQWVAGMNYKNHGTDTILDGFTLDFHTLAPVVLQNSIGQVVGHFEVLPGTQTVYLNHLPIGVYFWNADNGNNGILIKKE